MKFVRSSRVVNGKLRYFFGKEEVTAKEWDAYWAKAHPVERGTPQVLTRADYSSENGGKGRRHPSLAVNIFDKSPDCHFRSFQEAEAKCKARGLHFE